MNKYHFHDRICTTFDLRIIIATERFENFMTFCILVNTIALACEFHNQPDMVRVCVVVSARVCFKAPACMHLCVPVYMRIRAVCSLAVSQLRFSTRYLLLPSDLMNVASKTSRSMTSVGHVHSLDSKPYLDNDLHC